MKNTIVKISIFSCILLAFFACKKDEIENTASVKLAGDWYVKASQIDDAGNIVAEDLTGGYFHLLTYNTAANKDTELWIDDQKNFWDIKGVVNSDVNGLSFSGTDVQNVSYDSKFTVADGKVLEKAATTPSGSAADSIVFTISFDDDEELPTGGFPKYRISGYRYTGLTGDE
ncbi:Lipid-binding putative hydrolase [bacterium A37T11]|nr:Lipid-binding putative hydrolase [bacterium A37T11]